MTLSVAVDKAAEINLIEIASGGVSTTTVPEMDDLLIKASGELWSGPVATYTHVQTPTAPTVNWVVAGFTCQPNVVNDDNPVASVTANGVAMTFIGWQQWGYFNSKKRSLALYALAYESGLSGDITISATKTDGTIDLHVGCITGFSAITPAILDYGQNNPSGYDHGQLQFDIDSGTAPSRAFCVGSQITSMYEPMYDIGTAWSVAAAESEGKTGARTLDFEEVGAVADQVIWVLIGDSGSTIFTTSEVDLTLTSLSTKDDITVTLSS